MYRPEFAYPTPPGCRDEDFTYHFDGSNTPLLNQDISGKTIENIPLVLERDAPFYWRGWKVVLREAEIPDEGPPIVIYVFPNFQVKLRDCYDNNLQDNWISSTQFGFPQNPVLFNNTLLTGPPCLLEPEIYCPRAGVIMAWIQAPVLHTGPSVNNFFASFTLYGVKRFKECAS